MDIGTFSSKGVITNSDGDILAEQYLDHEINIIRPNWVEQDPEKCYWQEFKFIIRSLIKKSKIDPREVLGVGISSLSPVLIALNRRGEVIRPAIIYMDRRAWKESLFMRERLGVEGVVKVSGNAPDPYFAGYKVLWLMHNEPKTYAKTWKILNADKFIIFRLTDRIIIDKSTAVLYAPFYDINQNKWSHEVAKITDANLDVFPGEIVEPSAVVGEITHRASIETGLCIGTKVIAGGPDAIVSSYSAGMVNVGESAFMYGTTGCWFLVTDKPIIEPRGRLVFAPHVVPRMNLLCGIMVSTGALLKWFMDNFKSILNITNKSKILEKLDQLAAGISPGSEGLIVLPYFMGERTPIWDVNAKGVIFGLTLRHSWKNIYRALLEAAGYGLKNHIEIAKSIGCEAKNIFAVNGGAKSKIWRQIVSDIIGLPQLYSKKQLGAPFGDAYLAGIGVDIFKKFEDIKKFQGEVEVTMPNPVNYNIYCKYYELYKQLYSKTKEIMSSISQ
ncbi:MAG: FGGY family carbohydrate kinase [Nitrososphaerota archaeon]